MIVFEKLISTFVLNRAIILYNKLNFIRFFEIITFVLFIFI